MSLGEQLREQARGSCDCAWLRGGRRWSVQFRFRLCSPTPIPPTAQAIPQFKHGYVRHGALLAQLWATCDTCRPRPGGEALAYLSAWARGDAGPGGPPPAAAPFVGSLALEVSRVRAFLSSYLEQLWLRLLDATDQIRGAADELLQHHAGAAGGRGAAAEALAARLAGLRAACDGLGNDLVQVERFINQNVAACTQLAQMHDRPLPLPLQPPPSAAAPGGAGAAPCHSPELAVHQLDGAYLAAAQACLLGRLCLDPLTVGLSDAYELLRLVEGDAAARAGRGTGRWVPPTKFQRCTRKFWVHPSDVMALKAQIIRHLPILIFGDRTKLTEGDPSAVRFLADEGATSDSSDISSAFHTRLRREDGAAVARVRWYGERSARPDQQLFVERKVHREKFTGEWSSKERAPLAQGSVAAYLAGVAALPELAPSEDMEQDGQAAFLRATQASLVAGRQQPLLRTVYRRTAFQESSNNLVRISLDTNLAVVSELGAPRAPGDWDMGQPFRPEEVVQFPYAVVEVKLQAQPPQWVVDLVGSSGLLLPVPKFSKHLHGAACLFQGRCEAVPYWFMPDPRVPHLMTPATWEEMADSADPFEGPAADWLFPSGFEEPALAPPPKPSPLARLLRANRPGSEEDAPAASAVVAAGGGQHKPAWLGDHDMRWDRLPDAVEDDSLVLLGGGQPGASQRPAWLPPQPAALPQHLPQLARSGSGGVASPLPALPPLAVPRSADGSERGPGSGGRGGAERGGAWPGGGDGGAGAERGSCQRSLVLVAEETGTSTPHDSAQDIEMGRAGGATAKPAAAASAAVQLQGSGGSKGGAPDAAAVAEAGRAPALGSCFALQQCCPKGGGGGGAGGANGGGAGGDVPPRRPATMVRTRVEPKTFFANERTFLSWLQISVLVMMTGLSLLSGSVLVGGSAKGGGGGSSCPPDDNRCRASKISGAIIAPVALLFMMYALFMYKKRTLQILRRQTVRYDDQRGPVLLVAVLIAAMVTAYILMVMYIFN
eukprot:scaffold7.g3724.t1